MPKKKKKRPIQIQKDESKRTRLAIKTYKCTTNNCQKRPTKVTYTNPKILTKRIPATIKETYKNSVRPTDDTCERTLCTLIHESTLSHDIHVKSDWKSRTCTDIYRMRPTKETCVHLIMSSHWVNIYMSNVTDVHEQVPICTKRDPQKRPVNPLSWVHTESKQKCQKWPMYTKRYRYIQKETHKKDLWTLFHECTLRHNIHVKSDQCPRQDTDIYKKRPTKETYVPSTMSKSRYTCQKRMIYTKIDRYIREKTHKRDLWPSLTTPKKVRHEEWSKCQERPIYTKRNPRKRLTYSLNMCTLSHTIYLSKQTDIHERRPIYTKRDPQQIPEYPESYVHTESHYKIVETNRYTRKETYICGKRPKTETYVLSIIYHTSTQSPTICLSKETDVHKKRPICTKRDPQ